MRKVPFQNKKSSTKFNIKVKKSYFKLRKALFKRGLGRNCKGKNVLKFDEEKDSGIIFWKKLFKDVSDQLKTDMLIAQYVIRQLTI